MQPRCALFPQFLIAVVLGRRNIIPGAEATVPVGEARIKYLYSTAVPEKAPLLFLLPGDMDEVVARRLFAQWQPLASTAQWSLAIPIVAGISDPAVRAAEAVLSDAQKRLPSVDENRVYLVGEGVSTPEVFYMLSRVPDRWAAALADQGSAGPAINSFRLFGANTSNTPLLWIAKAPEVDLYRHRLAAAGFGFETQPEANVQQVFDWLAQHRRAPFPLSVDCETSSPAFARCYWIEMTKFDPKVRNDVLKSTRVLPGSGASLAIGPFGFDPLAEGPGAVVGWLPKNYQGPLRLDDRIVMLAGREVHDGREYSQAMDEIKEEKAVAILVQRGKDRTRIETRIVLPKREETTTARIEGRYTPDQKELLLIGRAVTQVRVTIPPDWPPLSVSWNGLDFPKLESAGCWLLSIEKDPPQAARCK